MSIEYASLFKGFQSVIGSYQDIAAIYTKLFSQGQIQKLATLITEIYDEEHVFTLTELQKYCTEVNQKEDDFIAEQYEMNSSIFRKNLTLIVSNLVEEIGRKCLERFRQDFMTVSNTETVSPKQNQYADMQIKETVSEKFQNRSQMPEIQEEAETGPVSPAASKQVSKSLVLEGEHSSNTVNRSFEINMNDLAQKAKVQHIERVQPQQSDVEYEPRMARAQNQDGYEANIQKRTNHNNYEREEIGKQISPYQKADTSAWAFSETRADENSQYENEISPYKLNSDKMYLVPKNRQMQEENRYSDRGSVKEKKAFYSPERNGAKISSPERYGLQSNSMLAHSYSRWSMSNGRPDPSILDSEFSYGQGASFAKSPKKFHHHILDIPGPGTYEMEEGLQAVKQKSPIRSFPKSAKTPSYFTKSTVPGAIYYPTKHFLSK